MHLSYPPIRNTAPPSLIPADLVTRIVGSYQLFNCVLAVEFVIKMQMTR
jgi:hypothetical protein